MGDGGVVCMPSLERFPVPEKLCGGNGERAAFLPEKKMRELERRGGGCVSGSAEKGRKVDERSRGGELEKGEFVQDRRRRGESLLEKGEVLESGEFVPDDWSKRELEKGEFVPDKWRKANAERSDSWSGRGRKVVELEKGEFVPDKWRKWERERSPGVHQRKEGGGRKELERRSRPPSKLDGGSHDRREDSGSHKHDNSNGKIHGKDSHRKEGTTGSWLKRHSADSLSSSGSKHHNEFTDRSVSKSRRISEDSNASRSEHLEKSSKNSTCVSSKSASTIVRHSSSRHNEPLLPPRGGYEKHGRSPDCNLERSSMHDRARLHDRRNHSPLRPERSPHDSTRHRVVRERTPGQSERSPHDRSRLVDLKDRPPGFSGRSPRERSRHREHKDKTPVRLDLSPRERGGSPGRHDLSRRSTERKCDRFEDKNSRRDSSSRCSGRHNLAKQSSDTSSCPDKTVEGKPHKEKDLQDHSIDHSEPPPPPSLPPPPPPLPPPPLVNGVQEELASMEEDMDICDTPPHDVAITDSDMGKWYYLDHFGIEQGPSKLMDLKKLVEEGVLLSDHLIKHSDSDRWVTVENAASPLVCLDSHSIVSDAVTQMVSPPQASGNLLSEAEDFCHEIPVSSLNMENDSDKLQLVDNIRIDERVGVLLDGYDILPGKELETIAEALGTAFVHAELENWGRSEGFMRFQHRSSELPRHQRNEEPGLGVDFISKETVETRLVVLSEKEHISGDSSDWFAGRWSCKGGDWKRNEDAAQDRSQKRKIVLNEGYPLCQMPKCGYRDPRWQLRDDLYHTSGSKKLDLPPWAFSWLEDKADSSTDQSKNMPVSKSCQARSLSVRGTKGTLLPVVRINACVVKDHGSTSASETRSRGKSKDRHSSRSTRSYSGGSDRNSVAEGTRTKRSHDYNLHSDHKSRSSINTPSDHVCTRDELALELGDWYYLDGASREHGPYLFSKLQDLVAKNTILEHTSVFRKEDNIWVPITTKAVGSKSIQIQEDKGLPAPSHSSSVKLHRDADVFSSFHSSHPHFIGFMCGKLHEFVMKSYKSREFAAAINGVLDPWLNANQPKDLDKQFTFNSSLTKSSSVLGHGLSGDRFWRSEEDHSGAHSHLGKRARMMIDGNNDGYDVEEEILPCQKKDYSFEDLWAEGEGNDASFHPEAESWGLLNCHVLARIFHFLRNDLKSLLISAATCKHWKSAVMFYRGVSRYVDFSPTGPNCSDLMFQSIMIGYDYTKVTTIILARCTSVSPSALQEVIRLFPCISTIDIRGCNQFKELIPMFENVRWIQSQNSYSSRNLEDPYSKARRLKQNWMSKSLKGSSSYLDSFDERGSFGSNGIDMDRSKTFKQGHYSRTKLLDARKSSGALSRNAQLKQLIWKKSENAYRKMEPLITDSLKSIMKDNTFEFLVPKVEEIEDRMRNGYYARHGLTSVKDDIRQMCRNVIKAKKRFNGGDLRQIVTSFLQLAERLEKPKKSYERDEVAKAYIDDSDSGSHSVDSKYKKKQSKGISEKRNMSRNINTSYANGGSDLGGYSFDRNIKKSLSRLNKRHMDSESETSDDDALFEEDATSEGESSESETESDLDVRSGAGMGNNDGYFMDEAIDTLEEREWGARMTKASLVPPVTRKYEVIDQYLIVADETEVERKMRVALPEDYAEKLHAQSSGVEEMEIPEVKDFKPRKIVGETVLEQEVYGIDPYTHNLLLDSMTKEMEWPLVDMHHFIEEVLLRTLNKQVRLFTGSGNAPMVYQLQPVIEEIKRTAEEDGDTRTMKMCYALLKAMRSRSIENYVSYRKGLGVVCNKENGFGEDDFVVEFLGEVYPAWKWYEKQDGIRSLQKNSKEPLPEFYNIYLERPKGDGEGYDLVVVDAMHKANYASRICHSCRPNCEAKVTAVDGHYQIGIYTLRPIAYGEEITFDYNSVTESKDEYEASVCLCGSQVCRGSYLNLTGEEAFQNVLKERHGMLERHKLMLEACETSCVSQEDYYVLARAGLGSCLLADLPDWLIAYSADLVRYINFERTKLPGEIVKHNVEEKMKYIPNYNPEDDKTDAEIQAEGVYNQRLQNMAVTIDKVKYVMRSVYGDPKKAPPPLEKLSPEDVVSVIWRGEGSMIEELLKCLATFMDAEELKNLKSKIHTRDPFGCDDLMMKLRKSLLWLRDEIRDLPCSQKCRNDAAADLLHMYAYTNYYFRVREYKSVTSEPVYISPLDMGPKYMEKMGPGFQEYCKTYGENYCLGQLIYWHNQTNPDPDGSLVKARRGCLSLPDVSSFYASNQKSLRKHIYGAKTLSSMLRRMEKLPQRPWPRDEIWEFKSAPKFFGSPMLDAVLNNCPLDSDMMHWLKNRPAMFQGARDG